MHPGGCALSRWNNLLFRVQEVRRTDGCWDQNMLSENQGRGRLRAEVRRRASIHRLTGSRYAAQCGEAAARERHSREADYGHRGWKTRSIFDRYTITDPEAMRRAMQAVTAPVQSYSPQIAPDGQDTGRAGKAAIQ